MESIIVCLLFYATVLILEILEDYLKTHNIETSLTGLVSEMMLKNIYE
jgi:hypothetical protein